MLTIDQIKYINEKPPEFQYQGHVVLPEAIATIAVETYGIEWMRESCYYVDRMIRPHELATRL